MTTAIEPLVLDLVEWIAREPRAYTDVMEAWRTSCPRLTVWEDAVDRGLIARADGPRNIIVATPAGRRLLADYGRAVQPISAQDELRPA